MSLRAFMTATATTERSTISSGKSGQPSANLSGVKITPPMLPSQESAFMVRPVPGFEGSAAQLWIAYTESHTHIDSGASVTQMPDIQAGDRLTVNSIEYSVEWAEADPATSSFGATLIIGLVRDKRA